MSTTIDNACPFPDSDALLETIRIALPELVRLTRDVFLSPYDLYLVDRATGVLGGFCQGDDQADPSLTGPGDGSESEHHIREVFDELDPCLPWIWTESGFHYFLPGLWMDVAASSGFLELSTSRRMEVAFLVKAALVDDSKIPGFPDLDSKCLDSGFWSALFDYDQGAGSMKTAVRDDWEIGEEAGSLFWLDRCCDRAGLPRIFAPGTDKKSRRLDGLETEYAAYQSELDEIESSVHIYGLHPSVKP